MYNAAGDPELFECGPYMADPEVELDDWFARAKRDSGASVVRFWAYQSYTMGGEDWRGIDRVMRLASKHQIKVIPVLENQWHECTSGEYKDSSWYASGYLEPYGRYKLSYREYVRRIVTRYRDERAILGWMLMNEAESMTLQQVADPEALYSFARSVSAYIKSLDGNHLVTLGVIGGQQPGTSDDGYERLHSLDTIDFLDSHDYDPEHEAMPSDVARDLSVSKKVGKPLVIGEAGITVTDLKDGNRIETVASRAAKFDAKLAAFFGAGGGGYLVWAWHPTNIGAYDFTTGDPLNQTLKKHAGSLSIR
jgi:endo-1,4-beta-mannosidase